MIFHHPGVLEPDGKPVAWRIRPFKMLAAFQALGYDVRVVLGNPRQRSTQIRGILAEIKAGKSFDFLYSENSLVPTLLTDASRLPLHPWLDYRLFRAVRKAGVPLGVFYRDIFWRFPAYREHLGLLKTAYAKLFLYLDLYAYQKWFDVIFLPSLKMLDQFPPRFRPKISVALPSGADPDCDACPRYSTGPLRLLYVGGIGQYYDLRNLWNAVLQLPDCRLTLCCRKEEWESFETKTWVQRDSPRNIDVVHVSGERLEALYRESHVLILTVGSHAYRTFAMPFKLFEYIAHRGPILCTAGTEAADFVKEKNAGIVVENSTEAIRKALENILYSPDVLQPIYHSLDALAISESWLERAKLVARSLTQSSG